MNARLSDTAWHELLALAPENDPNGVYYTGVGSRDTPASVMTLITNLAALLNQRGWRLRSGGARGADTAFEDGAGDNKDIYLPYKGFEGNRSNLYHIAPECFTLASQLHSAWHNCNDFSKKAHARNTMQVLGKNLDTPSAFLVCYTRDGALTEAQTSSSTGGTRTALVLADRRNVPILNLGYKPHLQLVTDIVGDFHIAANEEYQSKVLASMQAVLKGLGAQTKPVKDDEPSEESQKRRGFQNLKRR